MLLKPFKCDFCEQETIYFFVFIVVELQLSQFFPCCSPLPHPAPLTHSQSPPPCPCPLISPLYMFLDLAHTLSFPDYLPPPPLWLLLFVLYFHVSGSILLFCFVLLIRLHLQVRSYGICLSLTGLFHLA